MRHQDWPERLDAIITERHNSPLAWGTHDCCTFTADVILALTGKDLAADVRGTYTTEAEAAQMLKDRGGMRGIVTLLLGAEISPKMAQRGDIVMVDNGESKEALAVCIGDVCVGIGIARLQYRPMANAITAWRVA